MRCQDNTGFLVLHRCERVAEYQCVACGRKVCGEHAIPIDSPPPTALGDTRTPDGLLPPPPPPAGAGELTHKCLCVSCRRAGRTAAPPDGRQAAQPGQPAAATPPLDETDPTYQDRTRNRNRGFLDNDRDNDPYYRDRYHYPYYGGFFPYHSPYYYDHRDRSAFDRGSASGSDANVDTTGEPDALGS